MPGNKLANEGMKTPDETLFVDKSKATQIVTDQINCMGCLSQCRFSNWSDKEEMNYTTDRKADPRSFAFKNFTRYSLRH